MPENPAFLSEWIENLIRLPLRIHAILPPCLQFKTSALRASVIQPCKQNNSQIKSISTNSFLLAFIEIGFKLISLKIYTNFY
jgi:hypothetical protein